MNKNKRTEEEIIKEAYYDAILKLKVHYMHHKGPNEHIEQVREDYRSGRFQQIWREKLARNKIIDKIHGDIKKREQGDSPSR